MKPLSRLWLLVLAMALPAAPCPAQEDVPLEPEGPRVARTAADLTIPELLSMAENLRASGLRKDAVEALNLIRQRDANNVDALRMLGDIAWDLQNAEEAQTNWQLVRKIQPNDFGANWGLGRLYLVSGVFRNAIHYLETAESVVPADPPELKPTVLLALAQAHAAYGERASAIETVREALALDPDNYDGCYLLAALRANSATSDEDFDQALSDTQRVIEVVREDLEANGITLQGVQRLQTAYELELQVLSGCRTVLFHRNPDATWSDRPLPGKEKRLADTLSRAVDVMVRQTDVQRTLAYFRIVELAADAVKYDEGTASRWMDLALLQKATGQWDQAIVSFEKVLELEPLNKEAQRLLEGLRSQRQTPADTWPGILTP